MTNTAFLDCKIGWLEGLILPSDARGSWSVVVAAALNTIQVLGRHLTNAPKNPGNPLQL